MTAADNHSCPAPAARPLVATHDEALTDLADEVLTLEDGRIVT